MGEADHIGYNNTVSYPKSVDGISYEIMVVWLEMSPHIYFRADNARHA